MNRRRPVTWLTTSLSVAICLGIALMGESVAADPPPEDLAPSFGDAMITVSVSWPKLDGEAVAPNHIGSGFFFGEPGFALTANHVVSDRDLDKRCDDYPRTTCPEIKVKVGGDGSDYVAQRVFPAGNSTDDAALLQVPINESKHKRITWGNPFQAKMGAIVYALHFPNGGVMQIGKGGIGSIFGPGAHWSVSLDNVDTGSSGCAIFNSQFQVVGMLVEGSVLAKADVIPRNLLTGLVLSGSDQASVSTFLSTLGWDPSALASLDVDSASALVRYAMPAELKQEPIISLNSLWIPKVRIGTFDFSPRKGYELSTIEVSKSSLCGPSTITTWSNAAASIDVGNSMTAQCPESKAIEVRTVEVPSKTANPIQNILNRAGDDPAAKRSLETIVAGKTAASLGKAWANVTLDSKG